jgi:uncharacterized membrane protein YphA (DoxX/SURF4 family)
MSFGPIQKQQRACGPFSRIDPPEVQTADGPRFGLQGYEVNLLYVAGLLALILGGAGRLSIDGLLARTVEGDRHGPRK